MDPITLILMALVSGAATALKPTAEQAVKDAYAGLKTLLQRKFANKPKAESVLADHEEDPETYEKPLRKVLAQEQTDQDQDIIAAAKKLLEMTHPEDAARGKFNVRISGGQGFVIGDGNKPVMYFGDPPKNEDTGQ